MHEKNLKYITRTKWSGFYNGYAHTLNGFEVMCMFCMCPFYKYFYMGEGIRKVKEEEEMC